MFFKLLSYHVIKASKNIDFIKNQLLRDTNKLLIYSDKNNISNNISYKLKQYYINNNEHTVLKINLQLDEIKLINKTCISNKYNEDITLFDNIKTDEEIIKTNIYLNNNKINYNMIDANLLNIIDYYGFLNKISNMIDIHNNLNFLYNKDDSSYYEFYSYYIKILNNLSRLNIDNIIDLCKSIKKTNNMNDTIILIENVLKQENDIIIEKQLIIMIELIRIIQNIK